MGCTDVDQSWTSCDARSGQAGRLGLKTAIATSDDFRLLVWMALPTSCVGLLQAYWEPVSPEECTDDQDGEIESNTTDSWKNLAKATGNVLDDASRGVSDNTYRAYLRWAQITDLVMSKLLIPFSLIDAFDAWLVKHKYIQAGRTVFRLSISVLASSLIRVTFTLSSETPHTTRKKISGSTGGSRLR